MTETAPPAARKKKRGSSLPRLAQAGPVSVWMVLFVTIPMELRRYYRKMDY